MSLVTRLGSTSLIVHVQSEEDVEKYSYSWKVDDTPPLLDFLGDGPDTTIPITLTRIPALSTFKHLYVAWGITLIVLE